MLLRAGRTQQEVGTSVTRLDGTEYRRENIMNRTRRSSTDFGSVRDGSEDGDAVVRQHVKDVLAKITVLTQRERARARAYSTGLH
jgi:hypothetical protein